jgi:hypothetical protein
MGLVGTRGEPEIARNDNLVQEKKETESGRKDPSHVYL